MRISLSSLAFLSFTIPLAAQTSPLLIGCTTSTGAPAALSSTRLDFTTCATKTCTTILSAPGAPYAGGTAFDPTAGTVWHTDGKLLGRFDPNSCGVECTPINLSSTIGGYATGLAYNESTNTLFLSDSANTIYSWKGGCPPTVTAKCSLATIVPPGLIIAGLATSDFQKLIYYSASDFTAAGPNNIIYIAPQSTPCVPICKFVPTSCPGTVLGPITGLAYDDCRRLLWATDGSLCVGMSVSPSCGFQFVTCCKAPPTERYYGLCIMPSQATPSGASCTKAPCPSCPSMAHVTIGDATIGNPSFALSLVNAPAGVPAVLALNAGACTSPGIPISIFCANLLVPLPGIFTFSLGTGGTTGCTGNINFPLAVPLNPGFCGFTLSSQYLMVCLVGTSFGTGVSNCLSFTITAS